MVNSKEIVKEWLSASSGRYDVGEKVLLSTLLCEFMYWCGENKIPALPITDRNFSDILTGLGYEKVRANAGTAYVVNK